MQVQGGTHLGIISCFGEREFDTTDIEEVKRLLLEEFDSGKLAVSKNHLELCNATDCKSSDLVWEHRDKDIWCLARIGEKAVIFEIRDMTPTAIKDLVGGKVTDVQLNSLGDIEEIKIEKNNIIYTLQSTADNEYSCIEYYKDEST